MEKEAIEPKRFYRLNTDSKIDSPIAYRIESPCVRCACVCLFLLLLFIHSNLNRVYNHFVPVDHCEFKRTMTKSKRSQLFLVRLILQILALFAIHLFYWDCFDGTSAFLSFPRIFCSFTGMVYNTQTINMFYICAVPWWKEWIERRMSWVFLCRLIDEKT